MTFLQPLILALLLLVIALAGGYVFLQQRRRHYAVRFTNIDLLSSIAPKRPGWRRHVPAGLVGASLLLMVVALAQPVHETEVANESKIVMLAIDVSKSMEATDVAPTRLEAAVEAAQSFVTSLPQGYEAGLVAYSTTAKVVVAPTANHEKVARALGQLQPEASTATGDAIIASLNAIEVARQAAGIGSTGPDGGDSKSAAIILLSDGDLKVGTSLEVATQAAVQAGVPVSTITFGTDAGTVTAANGIIIPVPPDPQAMAEVASATGGQSFDAASLDELKSAYSQIQGDVGVTTEIAALWMWFLAFALLLLMAACGAAMFWSGRFL